MGLEADRIDEPSSRESWLTRALSIVSNLARFDACRPNSSLNPDAACSCPS